MNDHVAVPTHTSGHTPDLIISRSINDVIITELESTLALSDHSFIECNLNMLKPNFTFKLGILIPSIEKNRHFHVQK